MGARRSGACVCAGATRTLNGLDLGVGRELHVGGAEERGARVAARNGHDDRVHQVLDKRARDHDADFGVEVLVFACAFLVPLLPGVGLFLPRRQSHTLGDGGAVAHNRCVIDAAVTTNAAGSEGIAPGHAHVAVRLLVIDERIARELLPAIVGLHLRRLEHVKLKTRQPASCA